MHYRVGSLRIQGPVEREYLNNSGQAGQSDDAIEGSAPRGRPYPVIEAIVIGFEPISFSDWKRGIAFSNASVQVSHALLCHVPPTSSHHPSLGWL